MLDIPILATLFPTRIVTSKRRGSAFSCDSVPAPGTWSSPGYPRSRCVPADQDTAVGLLLVTTESLPPMEPYGEISKYTNERPVTRHMATRDTQPSWTDPEYVATVVGVLAVAVLVFYSALTATGPTVDEIVFVVLTITVPVTVAYELARRWQ